MSDLSRRGFLRSSAAAFLFSLVASAAKTRAADPELLGLNDSHVHLFNLSDLPARGFFEHGVLWNTPLHISLLRPLWLAMLDLIAFFHNQSISAAAELARYQGPSEPLPEVDDAKFKEMSYRRIRQFARESRHFRPHVPAVSMEQQQLRDSYYDLAALIRFLGDLRLKTGAADPAPASALTDPDIRRIQDGMRDHSRPTCPEEPRSPTDLRVGAIVRATLDWGRQMMQSREYHLRSYLRQFRDVGVGPGTIVNLLVDYDAWLGDAPAEGSSHREQIAFWSRVAPDYAGQVQIRTFAGFDPLKDAQQYLTLNAAEYDQGGDFAYYRQCWRNGRDPVAGEPAIYGFKLYPPMGFKPAGNAQQDFAGSGRALGIVRARWAALGLPYETIADQLNRSLDRLYGFCAAEGVPLLAHGRHSNEAGRCFGARAGPAGWREVLRSHPRLRLCLGHFAEARDFERGMRNWEHHRPVPPRVWALHGLEDLLSSGQVYSDVSYMSEFLTGSDPHGIDRARQFFLVLGTYCRSYDPECRHIMFGTDWIMLGREPGYENYVGRMTRALEAARWPALWRRNLLHDNLQRFLDPAWLPDRG